MPVMSKTTISRAVAAFPALGAMLLLKRHYSLASPDQLDWILGPTARLVALLAPARPVFESGAGYVDFSRGIIIAPSCAGINFLIMAFGLAVCCGLARMTRPVHLLAWLAPAGCLAYAVTVPVNALRIVLSMHLYQTGVHLGWFTPERVHRILGVIVYLGALWIFWLVLEATVRRLAGWCGHGPGMNLIPMPGWTPLGWYLAGTLGVPMANLLFQRPAPGFVEHVLTLMAMGLAAGAVRKVVNTAGGMFNGGAEGSIGNPAGPSGRGKTRIARRWFCAHRPAAATPMQRKRPCRPPY